MFRLGAAEEQPANESEHDQSVVKFHLLPCHKTMHATPS